MLQIDRKKRVVRKQVKTLLFFLLGHVLFLTPQIQGEADGIIQVKKLYFQGREAYYSAKVPLPLVVEVLTAAKESLTQNKGYEG